MVHPVDLYVGKKLKFRRNILGLSQEQLGKEIGITFQQIQKYEKGLNRISSGRLYDLAKILNVDIKNFFEGYSESDVAGFSDSTSDSSANSKKEEVINEQNIDSFNITQISGFSPDDKQILTLVKAFCKIKSHDIRVKILDLLKVISTNENIEENIGEDKK